MRPSCQNSRLCTPLNLYLDKTYMSLSLHSTQTRMSLHLHLHKTWLPTARPRNWSKESRWQIPCAQLRYFQRSLRVQSSSIRVHLCSLLHGAVISELEPTNAQPVRREDQRSRGSHAIPPDRQRASRMKAAQIRHAAGAAAK